MQRKATDRRWLWLSLAGASLMALGVWRGEAKVVLTKAVRICLECIGIG